MIAHNCVCTYTGLPILLFLEAAGSFMNLKLTDCLEQLSASLGILSLPRIAETSHCVKFLNLQSFADLLGCMCVDVPMS